MCKDVVADSRQSMRFLHINTRAPKNSMNAISIWICNLTFPEISVHERRFWAEPSQDDLCVVSLRAIQNMRA